MQKNGSSSAETSSTTSPSTKYLFFPAILSCAGFVCLIDFSVLIEVYLGDSVPIVLWDRKVSEVEDVLLPRKVFSFTGLNGRASSLKQIILIAERC